MLQNVLSNAVKYTEQGEIPCEIDCEMDQDARVRIRFCVTVTVSNYGNDMRTYRRMLEIFVEGTEPLVEEMDYEKGSAIFRNI